VLQGTEITPAAGDRPTLLGLNVDREDRFGE